jgi:hypothetical protein
VVLQRVRRRLHLRWALDAAVLGGTVAVAVATLVAALHLAGLAGAARGWAAQPLAGRLGLLLAVALVGGILGAAAVLARRGAVPLAAAATAVDRWLDRAAGVSGGEHRPGGADRARVALALGDSPSPFAQAAVADAAERVVAVPVREAAPLRRPRRLGVLAIATACGLVAVLAPVMAPTAATGGRTRAAAGAVPAGALAEALSEVEAIGRAARSRGDHELAAIADELGRWLARAAGASSADVAAAEDELAAIAARARQSAEDGAQAAAVLSRVAAALAQSEASRALGQAFARMDAEAIAREARAAGAAAGSAAALSGALARAAAAARSDSENAEPRRLSGLTSEAPQQGSGVRNQAAGGGEPAGPPERRLRRLERDLRESADACAADPARCGRELEGRANDLAAPARDAAGAEGRDRLARAAEQLRGGLGAGRGERGARDGEMRGQPGNPQSGAGRRGQSAGQAQAPGSVRSAAPSGGAMAEAGDQGASGASRRGGASAGAGSAADEAVASAARQAFEQAARGASSMDGKGSEPGGGGAGDGIGSGEAGGGGGQPPGGAATAGPRVELSIPEGAGPTRAEAIRTGAGRGFAQPGYAPVFRDYQAAMEDGLEHTEIPAERRQLVRRYFELIRPR